MPPGHCLTTPGGSTFGLAGKSWLVTPPPAENAATIATPEAVQLPAVPLHGVVVHDAAEEEHLGVRLLEDGLLDGALVHEPVHEHGPGLAVPEGREPSGTASHMGY